MAGPRKRTDKRAIEHGYHTRSSPKKSQPVDARRRHRQQESKAARFKALDEKRLAKIERDEAVMAAEKEKIKQRLQQNEERAEPMALDPQAGTGTYGGECRSQYTFLVKCC